MKRLVALAAGVFGCLVWASVALAQDPSQGGYGGVGGQVQGDVGGGGGQLPFTGLDVVLVLAAGALLLALGLGIRRLSRAKA